MNITEINEKLHNLSPEEIVKWALKQAKKPIVTTNFRPYASAILHLTTQIKPDIDVIWCDTGFNTSDTYKHAREVIAHLGLNIHIYQPKNHAEFWDITLGIPEIDTPEHLLFTEQVKLEPFRRAMSEQKPDLWFTNLRKGKTAYRDKIDIVSYGKDGVLKVSPFYHYSDDDLVAYLNHYQLPNEFNYFDPTKVFEHRECGLHT